MGCDIHLYVEYREREPRNEYAKGWRDFGARINPGRNYSIFERMAGVRGEECNAVVPPRGFPSDAGYAALEDNWVRIAYGKDADDCGEDEVDEATAARYASYRDPAHAYSGEVKPYTSTFSWVDDSGMRQTKTETRDAAYDGKPAYVAQPDWHTHSWLTVDEYGDALSLAAYASLHEEPEYHAILAALRSLEASGYETRVVFWFDN